MSFTRRDLLRYGLSGLAAGTTFGAFNPLRAMTLAADCGRSGSPALGVDKLLIINLRGGNDQVCTVVPVGDPTYNSARYVSPPGLSAWIDPAVTLPLNGSTYMELNPAMSNLVGAGSPDAAGELAWILNVGDLVIEERSHFTKMANVESGDLHEEHELNPEGLVPRLANLPGAGFSPVFPSCSVSLLTQHICQTTTNPQVHLRDVSAFQAKSFGTGLTTHLSHTPTNPMDALVDKFGDQLLAAHAHVQPPGVPAFAGYHSPTLFPWMSGETWSLPYTLDARAAQFLKALEGALLLLQHTACRVAAVELGSFDTHNDQNAEQDPLLALLSFGMRSVYERTKIDFTNRILTMCITEFGRTARVNGNGGTDHGVGCCYKVMGRDVRGGVYNGSGSAGAFGAAWQRLGSTPLAGTGVPEENACPVATHFLTVFREILEKRFGITNPTDVNTILPGLPIAQAAGLPASQFTPLNFLL